MRCPTRFVFKQPDATDRAILAEVEPMTGTLGYVDQVAATNLNRKQAINRAMLVGLIVGIGKEVWDINHGSSELGDLAADVIGIATFRIVLEF